jgi:hypothetical protein
MVPLTAAVIEINTAAVINPAQYLPVGVELFAHYVMRHTASNLDPEIVSGPLSSPVRFNLFFLRKLSFPYLHSV